MVVVNPTPTVTVCIPTRDRPDSLRVALQSVLSQSWPQLEVIVSDNASGPATAQVVADAADPRVVHDRLDTDVGLYGNLTRCLTLGRGSLRYVLHDDDVMLPGNIERKARFMLEHPTAGMVHSAFRNLDAAGDPTGPVLNWPGATHDVLQPGRAFIRQSIAVGGMTCVASVMLRSDAVRTERFAEQDGPYADLALWLRVALHHDVGFLPEPLVGYRVHAGSASSAYRTLRVRRGRTVTTLQHADVTRQAHGRFLEQADLEPELRDQLQSLLRRCDRRLRLRIVVAVVLPPRMLQALKRVVRWRRGSRLHDLLAVEAAGVAGAVPNDTDDSAR